MIPFASGSELRSFKILFKLILLFCRIFGGVLVTDVRRKLNKLSKRIHVYILPGSAFKILLAVVLIIIKWSVFFSTWLLASKNERCYVLEKFYKLTGLIFISARLAE